METTPPDRAAALEEAAEIYDDVALELDKAAAHARRAAEQFRDDDVPRGTAHAWATLGHVREADRFLTEQARAHRLRSSV